jgi:hypothetical protein
MRCSKQKEAGLLKRKLLAYQLTDLGVSHAAALKIYIDGGVRR